MKSAVIVFPGSNCDRDLAVAIRDVTGTAPIMLWHRETELPDGIGLIAVPGGFSYGDYLRSGAMAARSPVMKAVVQAAARGVPVLGICNGFQILCEAGLLPGALGRNRDMHFLCRDEWLRVENTGTAWTSRFEAGAEILIPLKSGEGRYMAAPETIEQLEGEGRVVFRYASEAPNGSTNDIAGICSADGRVVGLMPHPEHAIEPLTGPSDDGLGLFLSALDSVVRV